MRIAIALALVLSLAGMPAAALEVCRGLQGGPAASRCCCEHDTSEGGPGLTADCGCAMRDAPVRPAAPEPVAATTERVTSPMAAAALAASAISLPPAPARVSCGPGDLVPALSPSCKILCTFRC